MTVVASCGLARAQGLPPEAAAQRMVAADGLQVSLVAAEPLVRQTILVKFDDRGRLWTIQYLQYPNPAGLVRKQVDRWSRTVYDRIPEPPPRGPRGADRITILEDTNGDGRADRAKDFVDGLNLTTGLAFGHGGVYVLQVPYLLFYPDRDRNDVPDADPEVLLEGFGMEDAQSFANHLTWGPDGWLYGVNGSTTTCRIRDIEFQQGVWRYHPVTREFELFCEGGGNLFGLTFDARGQLIYSSNGGFLAFHGVQGAYYQKSFGKHGPLHHPYAYGFFRDLTKRSPVPGPPSTGGTIYLADTFPARYRGALICGNFLGHSLSWWTLEPLGSTFAATHGGLLADSRDPWCGPTDVCLGPDGAIYFSDFYDRRTAHPDPDAQWDVTNGRIYRIAPPDAPPSRPFDLAQATSAQLVQRLSHANHWFRDQARQQLAARRDATVVSELQRLARQSDDPELALQGLWALAATGAADSPTLIWLLRHPNPDVRFWAVRLAGDPRQAPAELLDALGQLAATEPSVVVRSQLAATARRLPGMGGLHIARALIERDLDHQDLYLPLLLWWAVEAHAVDEQSEILAEYQGSAWSNRHRQQLARYLVRRYAAAATADGDRAALALVHAAPMNLQAGLWEQIDSGLAERSTPQGGVGHGGFLEAFAAPASGRPATTTPPVEITPELRDAIVRQWESAPDNRPFQRLALRARHAPAERHLLERLSGTDLQPPDRAALWGTLAELGTAAGVPLARQTVADKRADEAERLAAVDVVGRRGTAVDASELLATYQAAPAKVRGRLRDLLIGRAETAGKLLAEVEAGRIAPGDLTLDQIRRIALYEDPAQLAVVRKHWGNIQPGTPEEKLATVRRFNNDLRAFSGDVQSGKPLFTKHCGNCHKLFGEGQSVGPDLTPANRTDRDHLLVSLVDPSAVVKSQYLSYVVTTQAGQVLTGLLVDQDAASVTLVDAKNQRTRLPRGEIAELRESAVSLMPERLLEQLSPQELRDLFAYLQSPTPPGATGK